jgi:hypothetical protein
VFASTTQSSGRHRDDRAPALKISHEEVADFLLKQVSDERLMKKAVCIAY